MKLFKFFDECDAFESWAKETEQRLQEKTPIEHIEAFRRKFNVSSRTSVSQYSWNFVKNRGYRTSKTTCKPTVVRS